VFGTSTDILQNIVRVFLLCATRGVRMSKSQETTSPAVERAKVFLFCACARMRNNDGLQTAIDITEIEKDFKSHKISRTPWNSKYISFTQSSFEEVGSRHFQPLLSSTIRPPSDICLAGTRYYRKQCRASRSNRNEFCAAASEDRTSEAHAKRPHQGALGFHLRGSLRLY
jgi:hypothetical protein